MTGALVIGSHADLARVTALAEQAGAKGFAYLARALASGRIAFWPVLPDSSVTRFKQFARQTAHRPAVLLIGDDDGLDRGPDGWALADRAIGWATRILIHGAGAEIAHYEAAIRAAEVTGRCLVIECSSSTLPAWEALVATARRKVPTLVIRPRAAVHPLPTRGTLH